MAESLATFLNDLSQEVIPDVAEIFPETANILKSSTGTPVGGEYIKGAETTVVSGVPCTPPDPASKTAMDRVNDAIRTETYYTISFPNYWNGTRIERDPYTVIEVQARGEEPAKRFRAESWKDVGGTHYECLCTLAD